MGFRPPLVKVRIQRGIWYAEVTSTKGPFTYGFKAAGCSAVLLDSFSEIARLEGMRRWHSCSMYSEVTRPDFPRPAVPEKMMAACGPSRLATSRPPRKRASEAWGKVDANNSPCTG